MGRWFVHVRPSLLPSHPFLTSQPRFDLRWRRWGQDLESGDREGSSQGFLRTSEDCTGRGRTTESGVLLTQWRWCIFTASRVDFEWKYRCQRSKGNPGPVGVSVGPRTCLLDLVRHGLSRLGVSGPLPESESNTHRERGDLDRKEPGGPSITFLSRRFTVGSVFLRRSPESQTVLF